MKSKCKSNIFQWL